MVRAEWILKVGIVGLLASLGGLGCGSKPDLKLPPASTQLWKINGAYIKATQELGSPPQKKDDLLPFLKSLGEKKQENGEVVDEPKQEVDPEKFFRSFGDNEEFVILWGVDYNNYDLSGRQTKSPVIAYEKYGDNGKRWVLQFRKVSLVTDEELAKLPFPPGHKPP